MTFETDSKTVMESSHIKHHIWLQAFTLNNGTVLGVTDGERAELAIKGIEGAMRRRERQSGVGRGTGGTR